MLFYDNNEIEKILSDVKYIRILIGEQTIWSVKKIFFNYKNLLEITLNQSEIQSIKKDMKVICKSSDYKYEYVFEGIIKEINEYEPITASIELKQYNKYLNNRKHERYYVDINTYVDDYECTVKNISKSGARIISKNEFNKEFYLDIKDFKVKCNIIRKNKDDLFEYGVCFVDIDSDIEEKIDNFILSICPIDEFSKYLNNKEGHVDTKIFIYSKEIEFTKSINRVLYSFKAFNVDFFYNYDFIIDLYEKEQPHIVLLNCEDFDENIEKLAQRISNLYKDINIFIFIPMDKYNEKYDEYKNKNIHFIYKPFFKEEIERLFSKYL